MRASLIALALVSMSAWAGDAARGEALYTARCGACHSLDENGAGPRHQRLWGRVAGTQPDFDYSPALRASKLRWTEVTLDAWLQNPSALVPGNKMLVQLASLPTDREDLIAFLKQKTMTIPDAGRPGKK